VWCGRDWGEMYSVMFSPLNRRPTAVLLPTKAISTHGLKGFMKNSGNYGWKEGHAFGQLFHSGLSVSVVGGFNYCNRLCSVMCDVDKPSGIWTWRQLSACVGLCCVCNRANKCACMKYEHVTTLSEQTIRNTSSSHDRLTRWIQVKAMIPYWCHLLNPLQSV
jgi:hypothetical protein